MSRELLYTALTRSRSRLVLLLEGSDATFLYDLTKPERSETARRNTNLFSPGVRDDADDVPYAEHLVHRTIRGELVRSKSELVIANFLHSIGLPYIYERELPGTVDNDRLRPDFSFIDDAGDVILWEHLGMLDRPGYAEGWDWKRAWYARNGYRGRQEPIYDERDRRAGHAWRRGDSQGCPGGTCVTAAGSSPTSDILVTPSHALAASPRPSSR